MQNRVKQNKDRPVDNHVANSVANNNIDRLSWGDTVFLHLEREGMPLNVASVCVFEDEIPFKACVRFVEAKLPLIPRYFKRVVPPPLNLGLPTWEYDPAFNIRNHLHDVTLKNGSDAELKTLAGKILSTVMDRRHPLWDLTLVHGLNGNRSALIFRLHHCLADGIAGVGIMNVLMDASPVVPRLSRKKFQIPVSSPPGVLTSLTTSFVDSYSDLVKRILEGYADASSMAERFVANRNKLASDLASDPASDKDEFSDLLPELSASTERLRFNVLYRGPQKFAWAEIPLAEIKAIKQACGTSVNDVILALVTSTVQRYLALHGDSVEGRLFRMMVPVNLRGNESPGELGNRISLVPVTVPLDIRDPGKLLAAVHERTEFLKRAHAAELVSLAGGWISMIPTSARELAGQVINRIPFTPFNMVCTNVPGPQYPLYLLGRKMLHCYPYVPIGGEMSLNCAILTYNGTAYFGFSGEVHAVPDLHRLEAFLKQSFAELREAAVVAPLPKQEEEEEEEEKKQVSTKTKTKAKSTRTIKSKTRTKTNDVPAQSTAAPEPDPASAPLAPLASPESEIAPSPAVTEGKVLSQFIA